MTLKEQVNDFCGKPLCIKAGKLSNGTRVFVGAGACRTIAAYNLLVSAVKSVGGGIVRWNGQDREVQA